MTKTDLKLLCSSYLYQFRREDLITILQNEKENLFLCINVDDFLLDSYFVRLFDFVCTEPLKCRQSFQFAASVVQDCLLNDNICMHADDKVKFTKKKVKIYFSSSSIRCSEITLGRSDGENGCKSLVNQLVHVKGRVVKVTLVKMVQIMRQYRCRECGHLFNNEAEFEDFYALSEPKSCPASEACGSSKFEEISTNNRSVLPLCSLYQEIVITEASDSGSYLIPKRMTVVLEEDLVDMCQIGDTVYITGVLRHRWQPFVKKAMPKIESVLYATWIHKANENNQDEPSALEMKEKFDSFWKFHEANPLIGRNIVLSHCCSDIYEMYLVKLALLLVLIGGVNRVTSSGTTVRGDPHLLLIGNPGTGKSQILKHAYRLAKRSTYSTGVGITSAGLTCAAVKVDGDWHLEPGALPLSHGGVCCIDEFHTLTENDRSSVREAMETQTVSVAKAGLKTSLPSRCAMIAAMNQSTFIDAPLFSRFDLILTLNAEDDEEDAKFEHDLKIAKFLGQFEEKRKEIVRKYANSQKDNTEWSVLNWNPQTLKSYIACVKQLDPIMSAPAEKILSRYFEIQRANSLQREDGKTTNRLRDSLIRLALAHCRLMYRTVVTVQDAIVAVLLVDCSMQESQVLNPIDILHSRFPLNPTEEYELRGKELLEKLKLMQYVPNLHDAELTQTVTCVRQQNSIANNLSPKPFDSNSGFHCLKRPFPESPLSQSDVVMTKIRCKTEVDDFENRFEKSQLPEDEKSFIGKRLKRFSDEPHKEDKVIFDDFDLEVDLDNLVGCSSSSTSKLLKKV